MKNKSQYNKVDPFDLEVIRSQLAIQKDAGEFLKTYRNGRKMENVNTKSFWDENFSVELDLVNQDGMTKDKVNSIVSLLPTKKIRILDIGFGQGYFEEMLQSIRKNYEIYGIDISSKATEWANKKFSGNFICSDISKIEDLYNKKSFDVVVAIELIEHISPSKIFNFYRSVHELLKKDGVLILSTPLNEGLKLSKKNPSGHVREYRPEIIKMELELSGFKTLYIKTLYAFRTYYRLKKLLARILRNRWEPNNIIVKAIKI